MQLSVTVTTQAHGESPLQPCANKSPVRFDSVDVHVQSSSSEGGGVCGLQLYKSPFLKICKLLAPAFAAATAAKIKNPTNNCFMNFPFMFGYFLSLNWSPRQTMQQQRQVRFVLGAKS